MAVALEGIADGAVIVSLCLAVVLLGAAGVTRSVTNIVADAIPDFSIAGHDVFGPLKHAIQASGDTLYGWALQWYRANTHWVSVMFHGTAWSITETIDGIVGAYDAAAHAVHRILAHYIPAAIHLVRTELQAAARALGREIGRVEREALREVTRVARLLEALTFRVPHLISAAIHEFNVAVIRPLEHFAHTLGDFVHTEVINRLIAAERFVAHTVSEITAAVGYAEDILPRLPSLGWDDLTELIDRIPWRRLFGLLTFGFMAHALIRAFARETGLTDKECRGKVKGICGTDPFAWENLLLSLAAGLALEDFEDIVQDAETLVIDLAPEFERYLHGLKMWQ